MGQDKIIAPFEGAEGVKEVLEDTKETHSIQQKESTAPKFIQKDIIEDTTDENNPSHGGAEGLIVLLKDSKESGSIKETDLEASTKQDVKKRTDTEDTLETDNIEGSKPKTPGTSKKVIIENNADYDQITDSYDGAEGSRKLLKDSRERGTIKEKESKVATKENTKQKIDSENTQEGTKEIDDIQGSESTKPEVSKEVIIENKTDQYQGAEGLRELIKNSKESGPIQEKESKGAPKQGIQKETEIYETEIYEGAKG